MVEHTDVVVGDLLLLDTGDKVSEGVGEGVGLLACMEWAQAGEGQGSRVQTLVRTALRCLNQKKLATSANQTLEYLTTRIQVPVNQPHCCHLPAGVAVSVMYNGSSSSSSSSSSRQPDQILRWLEVGTGCTPACPVLQVVADGVLIESFGLVVDEASLTGG
jgi:hypothetical protein